MEEASAGMSWRGMAGSGVSREMPVGGWAGEVEKERRW
jgi:hypothetical protein